MPGRASTSAPRRRRPRAGSARPASKRAKPGKRAQARAGSPAKGRGAKKRAGSPAKRRGAARPAPRGRARPRPGGGARKGRRAAGPRRSASRRRRRRRPSLRATLLALPLLAAGLAAGYLGWLRDSSLVAVDEVQVTGVRSTEAKRITEALGESARSMTTLNFDEDELREAVGGLPTVAAVKADPSLPDRVRIEVTERLPAVLVSAGGESVAAAGDGVLLRGLELGDTAQRLPEIELRELPARLSGEPLAQAAVVGAAPRPLRPLIETVSFEAEDGVEVTLRGAIPIRFGSGAAAAEKWAVAATILADPRLETLTYVDVQVPERPAVGGAGPSPAEAAALEAAATEAAAAPSVAPTAEAAPVPTDATATGP